MKQYLDILYDVLYKGTLTSNRTGIDTISSFGYFFKHNMKNGFPIVTTKKMKFSQIAAEIISFIRGYNNVKQFNDMGTKVWNANANADYWVNSQVYKNRSEEGYLGNIYGVQWRKWNNTYDQVREVIRKIKEEPYRRDIVVSAWNVSDLSSMCIPPCHYSWQVNIEGDNIDLIFNMRSVDLFLGFPYDITMYGILLCALGKLTGYKPRYLSASLGNTHIYTNHVEQVKTQLKREPFKLPYLYIDEFDSIDTLEPINLRLINYKHHPFLKGKMAV